MNEDMVQDQPQEEHGIRVLVTGGTGLVGKAIRDVIDSTDPVYSARKDEAWYFASSKDADLR